KTVAETKVCSQFYLNGEMPKEITAAFKKVPTGVKLSANVRALDSFDNASAAIVSSEFNV
ncbi:MAG: hypothetical protein LBU65_06935, partial [Planctomycetaceae bacterium]|nr:hypothetical protein [Planctomycetaceae bacterium]